MENCVSGKNEKKYYNDMLDFSVKNLMVFPYHLSDFIVKKLDVTPFQFYVSMLDGLMAQDKSYDSLPNFTAADCKYSNRLFLPRVHLCTVVYIIKLYLRNVLYEIEAEIRY